MSYQNLMKPKEVVAGVWLDIMNEEGRMRLNLMGKVRAAKEQGQVRS